MPNFAFFFLAARYKKNPMAAAIPNKASKKIENSIINPANLLKYCSILTLFIYRAGTGTHGQRIAGMDYSPVMKGKQL